MIEIETRKLDRSGGPRRPPTWGTQTTEEQENPETEPPGKPPAPSFPEHKCSHAVVYPITRGVPSPNPGRAGALQAAHPPPAPQCTTNNHQYSGARRVWSSKLPKPAISSPKASHYGYQNREGRVDVNVNLEFLRPMT